VILLVPAYPAPMTRGLEEVDLPSAIHLAFHKLEFGDLPLCLTIGP